MGEHKEPWKFVEDSPCYDVGDPIPPVVVDCDGGVCAERAYGWERIVACVNALEGVVDVAAVRELILTLRCTDGNMAGCAQRDFRRRIFGED